MNREKLQDQAQDKVDALKTLTPKQRRAVGVLIAVVIAFVVVFGLFFAVKARAESMIDIDCSKVKGRCDVSLEYLKLMQISNQNLAKALQDALDRTPACEAKNRT